MCLQPITILNPTKYVSIHYKDRFLLQVPCGSCAECQRNKSNEWLYRTLYEFYDTFENNGFAIFDTLTYNNDSLPTLDQLEPQLPCVPCFRSKDITNFFKRLRIKLERKYSLKSCCSYFLSSEYGTKKQRPHYHLLLFVKTSNIDPLEVSSLISECWTFGRTDGVPYKSRCYVLHHNVIRLTTIGEILRCANYVTKYVQKDCEFTDLINSRIKLVGLKLSVKHTREREKIVNEIKQFHVQSLHYGELALRDFDLYQIYNDGYLSIEGINKYPSL